MIITTEARDEIESKIRKELYAQWKLESAELIDHIDAFLEERIHHEFNELRADMTRVLKAIDDALVPLDS